ncbi:MAG: DNA-binding domain-containing protein [Burkholderiales bacterium]
MNSQTSFAQALLNPEYDCPSGFKTWNDSDPAIRFAVYRNNVVVSLIDSLADTFPVTQELVGEEFFRAMAKVFVQKRPPHSRVLAWLGEAFPDFIESFTPAASLPYLADVARLEMCRVRAYHAVDIVPVAAQSIGVFVADSQKLSNLMLTLHPSVHIIRSQFAVFSLWAAHQGTLRISTVDPYAAQTALIFRSGLDVEALELSACTGLFIEQLQIGESLVSAASVANSLDHEFDLGSTMAILIRWQLITSIGPGQENHEYEH